jgi:hypothetical protein
MQLGEFRVQFQHDNTKGTRCVLKDPFLNEVIYEGWARLHHKDNFSRKKGRKISFKRAIATLDRRTRTDMWIDFLHSFNV